MDSVKRSAGCLFLLIFLAFCVFLCLFVFYRGGWVW